jgi:hypothetical protein
LSTFELDKWSTSIREANETGLISFQAINCLWIQILLLDVAIQFYIHGHWGFEPMKSLKEEAELANVAKLFDEGNPEAAEKLRLYDPLYCESWGQKEASIVAGIVRAWRLPNLLETADEIAIDSWDKDDADEEILDWQKLEHRLRDWDLGQALQEEPTIIFGDDPAARAKINKSAMCTRLAELLELRAIFVVAYLFLHPDSSDIYESTRKEADIEMPIA